MTNQIGGATEIKMDKAVNLSLSSQNKSQVSKDNGYQNVKAGEQTAKEENIPDVSVRINGEEKMSFNGDKKKELTEDDVKQMSEALNEFMDKLNCNIQFKYNDKLDLMTIQMINKKTKEVIKEFPPEELLKTMEKTQEWIGIFLDRKA